MKQHFVLCFSRTFIDMISSWNTGATLAGSWTVEIGELDEAGFVNDNYFDLVKALNWQFA